MKLIRGNKKEPNESGWVSLDLNADARPIDLDTLGEAQARFLNQGEGIKRYVWDHKSKEVHEIKVVEETNDPRRIK